ncbi:hypothetical protein T492DRAFT_838156 [Pavlovales sp. CCMP2436]|nr:hypothetical protein T492DRAFT_838156 [Pavlovales sp. CCMP2436]
MFVVARFKVCGPVEKAPKPGRSASVPLLRAGGGAAEPQAPVPTPLARQAVPSPLHGLTTHAAQATTYLTAVLAAELDFAAKRKLLKNYIDLGEGVHHTFEQLGAAVQPTFAEKEEYLMKTPGGRALMTAAILGTASCGMLGLVESMEAVALAPRSAPIVSGLRADDGPHSPTDDGT